MEKKMEFKPLQLDEVENAGKPVKKRSLTKFLVLGSVALAVASAAMMLHTNKVNKQDYTTGVQQDVQAQHQESVQTKEQTSILANVAKKFNINSTKETHFSINEKSPLVNAQNKDKLNQAGDFELPAGLADNQVARKVAQIKFEKNSFYLSLLSEGEGFISRPGNDNIGKMWGNGWNFTLQNDNYNIQLSNAINMQGVGEKLNNIKHGKLSIQEEKQLSISPQRSMQASQLLGDGFEPGVIRGIAKQMPKNTQAQKIHKETGQTYEQIAQNMYNSLADNEKAAVLYHSYKVGEAGFAKYTNMIGSLITYGLSTDKTDMQRKTVADGFTYKYKINGQIKEDTRASILVSTMFANKEAFGYVIGKNVAPKNFSNLTNILSKNKITDTAAPGELKLPDPVGDEKAKIEAVGGKIDIQIIPDNYTTYSKADMSNISDNIKKMRENANQRTSPRVTSGWF